MTNTLHRIKEYIDFKGINISAFEKSIAISNGAFASQLKNNKTIGVDKLENILTVYKDLSAQWLLTGEGEMLRGDVSEANQLIGNGSLNEQLDKAKNIIIELQHKIIALQEQLNKNS